jgi:hypothetical protein
MVERQPEESRAPGDPGQIILFGALLDAIQITNAAAPDGGSGSGLQPCRVG